MLLEGQGINALNHLTIGGCDSLELCEKYGTPLYVIDENVVREHCRLYKKSIDEFYNGNGLVFFASKALCNLEMIRVVNSEGLGADSVSAGELYTVLKAGMDSEKICIHGNNKTDEELEYAIKNRVGRIVIDDVSEIKKVDKIAKANNIRQKVLFRIKPGIDAHTHEFIMTGQIDCKFGFALETGEAEEAICKALEYDNIIVAGVHCHIGSQIFESEPFKEAAKVLVNFMADIKDKTGYEMFELNLGGGFGVTYTEKDDPIKFNKYIEEVSAIIKEECAKRNLVLPFVMMEPGRSIVGTAGVTLYKAGAIKDIPGIRCYVSVDGGMTDNPRYILYQAEYTALVANKAGDEKTEVVTLAGKCCESGDLLGENMPIQKVESGDIIAVLTTGAYNYSMASNYNRVPRPAMVMVKNGESRVIVKRETFEDLVRNDI
ncbi:MAG: diaminopimelate decarboxylase [Clostridia bacterium]|nr:diaminopimelate decarboxylase [Clostridia bacterium]